jgi:hypothetical protein
MLIAFYLCLGHLLESQGYGVMFKLVFSNDRCRTLAYKEGSMSAAISVLSLPFILLIPPSSTSPPIDTQTRKQLLRHHYHP